MNGLIDRITYVVRGWMYQLAKLLNAVTFGKLTPNQITYSSLLLHLPVSGLIAAGNHRLAAVLLVVFGLFDALDGALAKVQNKAGNGGMLLDASTDRMKEVLLYTGVAYWITASTSPRMAAWAVLACGASLCVSYVKAKGETAVKDERLSANEVNRLFGDGLFRFQVRMAILFVGLLSSQLIVAVIIIATGSTLTAFGRLYTIAKRLA